MDKRLCASFASFDTISSDTLQYERTLIRTGYPLVAGLDEAGRGPLAGPVVAGCVILPESCEFSRFKDSKVLTAAKRESLYEYLHECGAYIGFSIVSPEEIDQVNILQASLLAMARSVAHLTAKEKNFTNYPD